MKGRVSGASERHSADVLQGQIGPFLEALASLGYVDTTRQAKRRTLERFVGWTQSERRAASDLDESCVSPYLKSVPRKKGRRMDRATLLQFLDHLRRGGVIPPCRDPFHSPDGILLGRYQQHLRRGCGLSERSISTYSPLVREFIVEAGIGGVDSVGKILDAVTVRRHLLDRARSRSSESTRLLAAALRSFLRFLFHDGETRVDLAQAVPPVRRWRLAAVPAFLSSDEVEQVLAAIDRTTTGGCRDYAILLLLARLGLRAGEITMIELDDIHWRQGEIVVRGKGGFHDRLPLPEDVGEAMALYLQHARGPTDSRRVFLRMCAPHVGLTGPSAISIVARQAIRQAGLRPLGRVGAHLFRHSLATRMIRHGASLGEISQILRHRCAKTTQIYAKVDFEALRGIARPWPVQAGGGR